MCRIPAMHRNVYFWHLQAERGPEHSQSVPSQSTFPHEPFEKIQPPEQLEPPPAYAGATGTRTVESTMSAIPVDAHAQDTKPQSNLFDTIRNLPPIGTKKGER